MKHPACWSKAEARAGRADLAPSDQMPMMRRARATTLNLSTGLVPMYIDLHSEDVTALHES